MHPPGSSSPATPAVPMTGLNQTLGQGIGIPSGSNRFSSLCSNPQSFVGNIGGPVSAGWSEARPMYGYGLDQPPGWDGTMLQPSFGLSDRSTSGFLNFSSLSLIVRACFVNICY